ncbi:MAG: hypothetical protein HYY04_08455 [Chloroflexi bacterium]|nr:hypothetical protein [Chloroflexota bacterium]
MGAGTERGETRYALHEAMREVVARLRQSDRPAVYAGVEIARFGLREKLITLVEKLDLPIATSIEGKAVFPEAHPNFVGIYMGRVGSALAREIVEGSDCLLMLGAFLTDVNTGLFTAQVDRSRVIGATAEETVVGYHRYPDVTLVDLIGRLLESTELPRTFAQPEFPAAARPSAPAHRPGSPDPSLPLSDTSVHDRGEEPLQGDSEAPSRSWAGRRAQGTEKGGQGTPSGLSPDSLADTTGPIRVVGIIEELNAFIARGQYVVVADVGDCLYACTELRTEHFLGPAYYNSVGFGVPAAVGAQLAVPTRRAIALVGDGGFQMTGMELTTARKLGINPIVILWNNTGYATLRAIAGRKPYFDLPAWDYVAIASALGCRGTRVTTREEFREALRAAESSVEVYLIDVEIDSDDLSPTWRQIAAEIRAATT